MRQGAQKSYQMSHTHIKQQAKLTQVRGRPTNQDEVQSLLSVYFISAGCNDTIRVHVAGLTNLSLPGVVIL